jgi:hypothetical protein
VCRQNGLNLIGPVLNGLRPTQATVIAAAGCHGLRELCHLGVEQRVAISGLKDSGLSHSLQGRLSTASIAWQRCCN